jgi:hypothetical protein
MSIVILLLSILFGSDYEVACSAPAPAAAADSPSSGFDDLRNWARLGLPAAAEWNVEGFSLAWHIEQVRSGHRLLPSVRLLPWHHGDEKRYRQTVARILAVSEDDWRFLREHHVPLCLRTVNIADAFTGTRYRLPLTPESISRSPLVWSRGPQGLNDERLADCLGPVSNWNDEGRLWAVSPLMAQLQARHPQPEFLIFLENNEGCIDKLGRYLQDRTSGVDAQGLPMRAWKPLAELKTLSLRMHDRAQELLAANPDSAGTDFFPEYWAHRQAQHRAFYTAFDDHLGDDWRGKVLTAGYSGMSDAYLARPSAAFDQFGYAPELTFRDAGSPNLYAKGNNLVDFTSLDHAAVLNLIPAWETAEARNPKAYREVSLHVASAAVIAGAQSGLHEIITPERYEGWVQWLLWSIHDPGVPVLLRHWCRAAETPQTPMFSKAEQQYLAAQGIPELASATSETYIRPIIAAVDRVAGHPLLRDFWLHGAPAVVPGKGHPAKELSPTAAYPRAGDADRRWRLLECSANPPREGWRKSSGKFPEKIKVWAAATIRGEEALLFAWTPCAIAGSITLTVPEFGDFEVEAPQSRAYWLVRRGGQARPLDVQ